MVVENYYFQGEASLLLHKRKLDVTPGPDEPTGANFLLVVWDLQENLTRPSKRNYQSVHSPDDRAEHLEVKRPRTDVVVSVVRKTVEGVAGLLRLRNPFADAHSEAKKARVPNEVCPVEMGVDEISNNNFNSLIHNMDAKREKQMDRALLHFHQNPQPSTRKHNGTVLYPGNSEKAKARHHRQSLQLLPPRPESGKVTTHTEAPLMALASHKPQLAVEEALKESDREHYRLLVEMVSEKYTNNKPLPCGTGEAIHNTSPIGQISHLQQDL
ncbi:hypothetical protein SKAU_G00254880 [Synaphobranchus kaupii]|uniref:Uncharacterized protein n=1 Tax=Synaphobranchus kaupii TaxID=118154 RepID=A0A9Q1F3L1_SYNKA|nr:hypothetical protein SKAU_G00254880 [Synaphobranchus kaupii]